MLVVNLFAGPGSGKSTNAAALFAHLKNNEIVAELITEYAKELVWDNRVNVFSDQLYILAKQNRRLLRLLNHNVEIAITDSPILQGLVYTREKEKTLSQLTIETFNKYNNINYFLTRTKKYSQIGRNQSVEEAIILDNKIKNILIQNKIKYREIDHYSQILNDII